MKKESKETEKVSENQPPNQINDEEQDRQKKIDFQKTIGEMQDPDKNPEDKNPEDIKEINKFKEAQKENNQNTKSNIFEIATGSIVTLIAVAALVIMTPIILTIGMPLASLGLISILGITLLMGIGTLISGASNLRKNTRNKPEAPNITTKKLPEKEMTKMTVIEPTIINNLLLEKVSNKDNKPLPHPTKPILHYGSSLVK